MGTKIIELPVTSAVLGDGYIPISQDATGSNRVTYKVTAQQIANYIGLTTSSGTVNNVAVECTDGSLAVTGSPITTKGVINVSVNSITLDKINSGGATNGQVLTYDAIANQWKPIDSSNTGVTADSVQIGTVLWFAASSAPLGYLECNGSSKKISDYPELAVLLGTTYGSLLNGGTEFILPDLRGEFVRGWSHGKTGVDTGRPFGSKQSDTTAIPKNTSPNKLNGDGTTSNNLDNATHPSAAGFARVSKTGENVTATSVDNGQAGIQVDVLNSVIGDPETRPRNIALLPCIKAIKTVQTTSTLLNFIEKPLSPTNGQILAYNTSTNTWTASTLPSTKPTFISNLTTDVKGTPVSWTDQDAGYYFIDHEGGSMKYGSTHPTSYFSSIYVNYKNKNPSVFVELLVQRQEMPFHFYHNGGPITIYLADNPYTDNSGTGIIYGLYKNNAR